MQLHQWQLKDKQKGTYFPHDTFVVSPDYEWQYQFNDKDEITRIGIIGWPNQEESMVWQAMLEGSAFLLREYTNAEREKHITLHTTSTRRKGRIVTESAGIHETSGLISFIKQHKDVHIYHASQYKSGADPRILVFDATTPSEERYHHIRSIPIRTRGQGFYLPLVSEVFHMITRIPPRLRKKG